MKIFLVVQAKDKKYSNENEWTDPEDLEVVYRDQDYVVRTVQNRVRMFSKIASMEMYGCHEDEDGTNYRNEHGNRGTGKYPEDHGDQDSGEGPTDCTNLDPGEHSCARQWNKICNKTELIDTTMIFRRIRHLPEDISNIQRPHASKGPLYKTLPADEGFHDY